MEKLRERRSFEKSPRKIQEKRLKCGEVPSSISLFLSETENLARFHSPSQEVPRDGRKEQQQEASLRACAVHAYARQCVLCFRCEKNVGKTRETALK